MPAIARGRYSYASPQLTSHNNDPNPNPDPNSKPQLLAITLTMNSNVTKIVHVNDVIS